MFECKVFAEASPVCTYVQKGFEQPCVCVRETVGVYLICQEEFQFLLIIAQRHVEISKISMGKRLNSN